MFREPRVRVRPTAFPLVLALLLLAAPAAFPQSVTGYATAGFTQGCVADSETLCLNDNRFAVTAGFQLTPSGPTYQATAMPLTADSGYFWFFDPNNVELVVKVLNGCFDPFNTYWVFAAGLTNVGVELVVTDTRTQETKIYVNEIGTPFQPIQDTGAFRACP